MLKVRSRMAMVIAFMGVVAAASTASATAIVYNAQLTNAVTQGGTISQPNANPSNPEGAEYFSFSAIAGSLVTIDGERLDGPYDMTFWVFSGLFADTAAFGGSFDGGDSGFIDFADDETAPFIAGPFGDPLSSFIAPVSGFYTIAVTNFFSDGIPPYDFQLTATGVNAVPEPASLVLLGSGLVALGARRRKNRASSQI